MKRAAALLLGIAVMGACPVSAQSPREQLNQLVTQLQANAGDAALRERIIKLALEMKPPPAVPEEAERRMARGSAAFKAAKNESDYKDAVREFEQASNAAPWSGDIYYNLGFAQDKAGDYAAAIRSLKLAMLAAPESRETKNLLYEVEYRQEKAGTFEAQAAIEKQREEALLGSLDGALFAYEQMSSGAPFMRYVAEVRGGRATFKSVYLVGGASESVVGTCHLRGLECELDKRQAYLEVTRLLLKFAADGREAKFSQIGGGVLKSEMVLRRLR